MDANTTKKTYAQPALASHGSVVAKTEGGIRGPVELDNTPSKAD
jgi:hypothetical protein